ncbi:MAG TPA: DUF4224 domain-containing protein [Casimicrobiaceae bacterium]
MVIEDKSSEQSVVQMAGAAAVFLNPDELALLTGFHRKGRQVEQLRRMGIAFYVNGCGRPVVARAAIEGSAAGTSPRRWTPSMAKGARGA